MTFREKEVLFGTVSGGFNLQVADDGQKAELTICAVEGDSYPVRWTIDGNVVVTDTDMEWLRGRLTGFARIFDKKVSEAVGSFVSRKRAGLPLEDEKDNKGHHPNKRFDV